MADFFLRKNYQLKFCNGCNKGYLHQKLIDTFII